MIEIIQHNDDKKGSFEAIADSKRAGLMTYTWTSDDKLMIDHTEVDPAFGGKGIGKEMVRAAVEFARDRNIRIIPLCPFAKAVFGKNPDFQDVLI